MPMERAHCPKYKALVGRERYKVVVKVTRVIEMEN